ncbi:hypothetical protein GTA08_BOTSDO03476 [Neofusicoccum parvum]|uniref:Uncharacterized protein n=1 Tax=Neofusicoccum parvum TaxID=310453 RepID=A0ACB5RXI2_9PEZI|nr:hypothetical protein GTA08_BOTSDO03476 [Neofusicoccum parvum]
MLSSASRPRPPLFIAVAASLCLLFLTWSHLGLARQNALNGEFVPETVQLDHSFGKPAHVERPTGLTEQPTKAETGKAPCAQLPGADDVFVVMKTSATEVHQKLPVHLETTFRCIPNFAVFSDYEEEVHGQKVYDVLDEVNETLRKTHSDFTLYRQLHEYKSMGKDVNELNDLVERQALKLDKWKLLPLMEKTLKLQPEAKFYFFMEADTYIVWPNLLQWLSMFDPEKPLYVGGQNWMLDKQFASSGSGIILSKNSLERVVAQRRNNLDVFDKLTAADYAGDVVLARAMETVAVPLTGAFPIIQGENPYTLDYTKNHWCYPVVSYHRMKPEWTKAMWEFEQSWMSQGTDRPVLRHRDVFAHVVAPQISGEKDNWDNLSDGFEETPQEYSLQGCREACAQRVDCVQYLFSPGRCQTDKVIRLGQAGSERDPVNLGQDTTSGWVVERINAFIQSVEPCQQDYWITAASNN